MGTYTFYIPDEDSTLLFECDGKEYREKVIDSHGHPEAPGLTCLEIAGFHDCEFGKLTQKMTLMKDGVKHFYRLGAMLKCSDTFVFNEVSESEFNAA